MKAKTKVILGSAMTVAMCASLIAGSTFALFTSESKTNIAITAGKVAVSAAIKEDSLRLWSFEDEAGSGEFVSTEQTDMDAEGNKLFAFGGTAAFKKTEAETDADLALDGIIPGDKAEFEITVTNNSSVDVKYQYALTATGNFALFHALKITVNGAEFVQNAFVDGSSSTKWAVWSKPAEGEAEQKVTVTVELPYPGDPDIFGTAGSIQGTGCDLTFAVNAIQANANTVDPDGEALRIYNLEELNGLREKVNKGNDYAGETIYLMENIDFEPANPGRGRAIMTKRFAPRMEEDAWAPIGTKEKPFKGTFEGNDHTISNFTVNTTDDVQTVGFFGYIQNATVQHLHFVGVNVTASGSGAVAGVVAGQAEGSVSFVDVTVEGTCKAQEEATVGGLVGKLEGEETKLTVEGSSFKADEEETPVEGKSPSDLVGDVGTTPAKNVTVTDSSVTDENGSGTEWDEEGSKKITYMVGTFGEFAAIFDETADTSNVRIVLTDSFDTSSIEPTKDRLDYSGQDAMFAAYYFQSFAGELDGAGNTITLKANDRSNANTRNDACGTLFKEIAGGAYIHDLTFSVNSPSSESWGAGSKLVGGFIATAATVATAEDVITIEKVTMTGSANNVRAAFINRCGIATNGVAGTMNFIDCTNDVRLQYGSEDGAGVDGAGEVGAFMALPNNWTVNFTNCVNKKDIVCGTMSRGSNSVGGFVANAGSSKLTFINCRNEGNISLMHNHNGTNAEANPGIGGFVGRADGASVIVFDNCIHLGSMTSQQVRFSLGSAVRSDNHISIGGFIGRAAAGSVTFQTKNINGNENGYVEGKGDVYCADFTVGDIRAGGFIGYSAATVTFGGTVINTGKMVNVNTKVVSLSEQYYEYPVNIYAGGLIGQSEGNVTFEAGCEYSNLAGAEVSYTLKNPMKAYFGGIIGYVSKGTVTVAEGATGSNSASTFTVENTGESDPTTTVGSFAGFVYSTTGLDEAALSGFTDSGSLEKKIGSTNA